MAGMYATDLPPRPRSRMPYVALTEAHQAHAMALKTIWRARVNAQRLKNHHAHPGDVDGSMSATSGAIGETAFCLLTNRPLIDPRVAAETWKLADVDGYSVRTTGASGSTFMNLLMRPTDEDPEANHHSYAVIFCPPPYREAWLAGVIARARALEVRVWEPRMPTPGYVVENPHLVDYVGPPPPLPPKGWRPPTVDEIFRFGRSYGQ